MGRTTKQNLQPNNAEDQVLLNARLDEFIAWLKQLMPQAMIAKNLQGPQYIKWGAEGKKYIFNIDIDLVPAKNVQTKANMWLDVQFKNLHKQFQFVPFDTYFQKHKIKFDYEAFFTLVDKYVYIFVNATERNGVMRVYSDFFTELNTFLQQYTCDHFHVKLDFLKTTRTRADELWFFFENTEIRVTGWIFIYEYSLAEIKKWLSTVLTKYDFNVSATAFQKNPNFQELLDPETVQKAASYITDPETDLVNVLNHFLYGTELTTDTVPQWYIEKKAGKRHRRTKDELPKLKVVDGVKQTGVHYNYGPVLDDPTRDKTPPKVNKKQTVTMNKTTEDLVDDDVVYGEKAK